VRARLEKQGQMDALRNQIIERKVIEMIVEAANVTEEKVDQSSDSDDNEFAVYHSVVAAKEDSSIPQAKYDDKTPAGADKDSDKS
jgi:trigger factor